MKKIHDQLLYGGDYNPDQWLNHPEILREDIYLMKKARINTVTLGIFSWAKLEPEENKYDFDWLENIINNLYNNGIYTILGTPSGSRPCWLADKYPEVLRTEEDRRRILYGMRENHCYTSPKYRDKVRNINLKLAQRFDNNPAVILWHISNEFSGECHCDLCQNAFRLWLRRKYGAIDVINEKWNTSFWGHDYNSFDQIESPSSLGEQSIDGLLLDWKRFVTYQTADFIRNEIKAIRDGGGMKPITTNLMYHYKYLNYHEIAKELDIVSWDNYPMWHKGSNDRIALDTALQHDIMRSLKKKPFLLMESCPGATNWQPVSKLPRPGMIQAAAMQAIAHGSDSVLYFQIRKSRGGYEKFHGAVIDHSGSQGRIYQEVSRLGENLNGLGQILNTTVSSEAAILFDWENWWALEISMGPRNENMFYKETVLKSYRAFRKLGLNVDVIDMSQDIGDYKIVVAPMHYMFRENFQDKVRKFVEKGGIFILTYWSGIVDDNALCFMNRIPDGLTDVMGFHYLEIDALYDGEGNFITGTENIYGNLKTDHNDENSGYKVEHLCHLIKVETAVTLFTYTKDYYKDMPCITKNKYKNGEAYYIGADCEQKFYDDFYAGIVKQTDIGLPLKCTIPDGVEIYTRADENNCFLFIQNFNEVKVTFDIGIDLNNLIFTEYVKYSSDGVVHFERNIDSQIMMPYESRVYRITYNHN